MLLVQKREIERLKSLIYILEDFDPDELSIYFDKLDLDKKVLLLQSLDRDDCTLEEYSNHLVIKETIIAYLRDKQIHEKDFYSVYALLSSAVVGLNLEYVEEYFDKLTKLFGINLSALDKTNLYALLAYEYDLKLKQD